VYSTSYAEAARTFETAEARLGHLRSLFADTTPLLQAAIASTAPQGVVQTRLYERASATRWSKGRVTLLGDAAHCMYPSLGLGISTAFGDAVQLTACLVGEDATKAKKLAGGGGTEIAGGAGDFVVSAGSRAGGSAGGSGRALHVVYSTDPPPPRRIG
jgi:hypothetical protein